METPRRLPVPPSSANSTGSTARTTSNGSSGVSSNNNNNSPIGTDLGQLDDAIKKETIAPVEPPSDVTPRTESDQPATNISNAHPDPLMGAQAVLVNGTKPIVK
jgi:hypothetical protein